MPTLTVIADDTVREIPFSPGPSVRELLDTAGLPVRSGCLGNGACGLCLVGIEAGSSNSPTAAERLSLSPEQLERNTRLACQLMPQEGLCVRIINAAPKSNWRELTPTCVPCAPSHRHPMATIDSAGAAHGLAVDLGTTHISLSLWDLKHGNRLSGRTGLNPQSCYGTDVVTRLVAAGESSEDARRIGRMPLDAASEALLEMCSRNGLSPGDVVRVAIVGNTPMLALVTESDPLTLLQPRSWTRPFDCRPPILQTWVSALGIHPEATVEVIAPLAGFVGSDLLVGVLATSLTDGPGGLLIDFGTNTEIALWDGNTLWVTSAAGGPAFEGCGMQCGMPAEPGAICGVDPQQGSTELRFQVIGGGQAVGLCGSGMVDLIAALCGTGDLTPTGKFTGRHADGALVVQPASPPIRLTRRDVDVFQRAKAAVGVGIQTLLAKAQMSAADLNRVCVCGVFGQHLNARNAQSIGLLPDIRTERVEFCGNTALAGCERLLGSPAAAADLASLRERAAVLSLSHLSDFDMLFLENLYLQPLKGDEP